MTELIISTILSVIAIPVGRYVWRRHKQQAHQPAEPAPVLDMVQGTIGDIGYVLITEDDGRLSLFAKSQPDLTSLDPALAEKYDITIEDNRLAVRARRVGSLPIVEDTRRLLGTSKDL